MSGEPDLLIANGRVIDPSQKLEAEADVLLRNGAVFFIGDPKQARALAADKTEILDASGKVVTPGLIDMHVHLREPGMEEEETIASGCAAAVAGGFTSVACMPNTDPALDNEAAIIFVQEQARKAGLANVFPVGTITRGRRGQELAEMAQMARGGAVAFSDDGNSVPTAGLLRHAMLYARMLGKAILEHCEDPSLSANGVMHEGYFSTILGLPGTPAEAEEIIVARDVALAKLTGARLHIQHVSTAGSVEIIRRAKAQGVAVTAEVCPHHLVLTDECVRTYNPVYRVSPPLRTAADAAACLRGLQEGVIDVIASDHAPHLAEEKELEFAAAPAGMIGLETTMGVLLTEIVAKGLLSLPTLIARMTIAPAQILGIDGGTLRPGAAGDVTIWDLERAWVVEPKRFRSKSRNCPYRGRALRGATWATVVKGRVVYRAEG